VMYGALSEERTRRQISSGCAGGPADSFVRERVWRSCGRNSTGNARLGGCSGNSPSRYSFVPAWKAKQLRFQISEKRRRSTWG